MAQNAQSPINVDLPIAVTGNLNLAINWLPVQSAKHSNDENGLKIAFDLNDNSYIMLDGQKYLLHSMHFHRPGEHTFDGLGASTELHVVHSDASGNPKVVMAMFFDVALEAGGSVEKTIEETSFMIFASFISIAMQGTIGFPTPLSFVPYNPSTVLRYPGSLTTAPYTEGLTWLLFDKLFGTISIALPFFNTVFPNSGPGHARDTQPLNGRVVLNQNWGGWGPKS